jgi:hypothetical protein
MSEPRFSGEGEGGELKSFQFSVFNSQPKQITVQTDKFFESSAFCSSAGKFLIQGLFNIHYLNHDLQD